MSSDHNTGTDPVFSEFSTFTAEIFESDDLDIALLKLCSAKRTQNDITSIAYIKHIDLIK